ncbi:MAG: hypothetical protein JWQ17_5681 [Tardiphaga sp.]|nr:hypothetical protein [Tardiphaga sp.]
MTGHKIDTVIDILETYLPRDDIMAANAIGKLDQWRSEGSKRALEKQRLAERSAQENVSSAPPRSKRN